ncbi:MAG: hypothetical protein KTR20_11105 [Cellvibrionaceae bacterium]|nr:hypothetical protein [Cellvibrionaceae bacterium]
MSLSAFASVTIAPYERQAFNPTQAQSFTLAVTISQPGTIVVSLYTVDGDQVRVLTPIKKEKAGTYNLVWDGKDANGNIVPNEAYIPVVQLIIEDKSTDDKSTNDNSTSQTFDPRKISGGEEITITPQLNSENQLIFALKRPARILARAGVKSGPLLNTLVHWQVRNAGRNVIFWDGYDRDRLTRLAGSDQLALLVTGFTLPDHSILTTGNTRTDYLTWRQQQGWSSRMPDFSALPFERNGKRLSRHHYLPRAIDIEPRVTLHIVDKLPRNEAGIPIVSGPVALRVNMSKDDQWAMQQSLYEIAFFIDHQFVSEEEQGYVPLTWRWNPVGLTPGEHLITVNVSGFNGQVGVHSMPIIVSAPQE